jgi:radical SAM superfamily enzyme YgiQ (UPF0313 family)
MRVTFVYPAMGRAEGVRRIRSWEMQPLAPAVLKAVTPPDIDFRFYDDRLEAIPYDEPTDLVGITVETYTAKRAYQIASEFRRRGVPVVMGGFHATLATAETARYAESVVVGEGERIWPEVLEDAAAGRLKRTYEGGHPQLGGVIPDRSVFSGKRYLPIALAETGRGCPFSCEFCAVRKFYGPERRTRPVEEVLREVGSLAERYVFFVDDNMVGDSPRSIELLHGLAATGKRWVTQSSIDTGFDEDLLSVAETSGCVGILSGLESLDPSNLKRMGKGVNLHNLDYAAAIDGLRRHGIWSYATFLLGYDHDRSDSADRLLRFAVDNRIMLCGFNHVTPFPGTALYDRLEHEGRLRFEAWWLEDGYHYDMIPYEPAAMTADEVERACLDIRMRFYGARSLFWRSLDFKANCGSPAAVLAYWLIGAQMYRDVRKRNGLTLGDSTHGIELMETDAAGLSRPPSGCHTSAPMAPEGAQCA